MKASTLYSVTGPSGKVYFGITSRSIVQRWGSHCSQARHGHMTTLHRAIRKYGEAAFTIKALVVGHRDYIEDAERRIIAAFNSTSWKVGYNRAGGGVGCLGVKPSARAVAATIARSTGRKHTPEAVAKMQAWKKANPQRWSAERKAAYKATVTGRRHTPETKAKMSAAMRGLKRTPEGCANISASKIGLKRGPRGPMPDDIRAKVSAGRKGKGTGRRGPMSEDQKAKVSASRKGKGMGPRGPMSAEARAKMSASARACFALTRPAG